MKKLLLLSIAVLMGVFVFAQNKVQKGPICERIHIEKSTMVDTWAEAGGMFNVTDINGGTHDLATYLAAGKTVILDFSAIWCAPCWSLHQSGVLDGLHDAYGPDGTDELVVLWVECDDGTLDEINGIGTSTQGDWTEDGTWPVPIIQGSSILNDYSELYEGYVPTVFMVCPSGYYKDITAQCWDGVADVYAEIGSCPVGGVVPTAEIVGPSSLVVDANGTFEYSGVSVDDISAYAWTFENGTPLTSTTETQVVSWDTPGEYDITLVATNATGDSPIATATVTVGTCDPITTFPWTEGFEGTTFPPLCWSMIDEDGDGYNWMSYEYTPNNGAASAASASYSSVALTPENYLITPQISIPTSGASLKFFVAGQDADYSAEHYEVMVSTTGTDVANFTSIFEETIPADTDAWNEKTVSLSAYADQDIYIAFVHNDVTDMFVMKIDDVSVDVTTDIASENANIISVFPNPVSDIITVANAENANITIVNVVGEIVRTIDNASANQIIDMSDLSNGTYIVRVDQEVFKINLAK